MSKWQLFVLKITSPFVSQKGGDDRRHAARESQFPIRNKSNPQRWEPGPYLL